MRWLVRALGVLVVGCIVVAAVFLRAGVTASTRHSAAGPRRAVAVAAASVSTRHAQRIRKVLKATQAQPQFAPANPDQGQACLIATSGSRASVPTCGLQACSEPITASSRPATRPRPAAGCDAASSPKVLKARPRRRR